MADKNPDSKRQSGEKNKVPLKPEFSTNGWGDFSECTFDFPLDGNFFIGKYKIVETLANRGQSTVFLAHDPDLNRQVVVKLYHSAMDERQRQQVVSEGRALARIDSSYVARCFTVDSVGDAPFLVMEWIDGQTLTDFASEQSLDFKYIRSVFSKIAEGVAAIHEQELIHSDLKPGNIMIDAQGEPKIIDFGLVRAEQSTLTELAGTYAYMSPEVARNQRKQVGVPTDIFGLGGVLYFLLTGKAVYEAPTKPEMLEAAKTGAIENPADLRSGIPPRLNACCLKCLRTEPVNRFQSTTELLPQLRPSTRRRWLAIFFTFAGLLLAVALLLRVILSPNIPPKYQAKILAANLDIDGAIQLADSELAALNWDDENHTSAIREWIGLRVSFLLQIPDLERALVAAKERIEFESNRSLASGDLTRTLWVNEAETEYEQVFRLKNLDTTGMEKLAGAKRTLMQGERFLFPDVKDPIRAISNTNAAIKSLETLVGKEHIEYIRAVWQLAKCKVITEQFNGIEGDLKHVEIGLKSIFSDTSSDMIFLHENRSVLTRDILGTPTKAISDARESIRMADLMNMDNGMRATSMSVNLGQTLLDARQFEEAELVLQQAAMSLGKLKNPPLQLGQAYMELGQMFENTQNLEESRRYFDLARKVINQNLDKDPMAPVVRAYLDLKESILASSEGRYDKAIEHAENGVEPLRLYRNGKPQHASGKAQLAMVLILAGKLNRAESEITPAIEMITSHRNAGQFLFAGYESSMYVVLAKLRLAQLRFIDAESAIEMAMNLEKRRPESRPLEYLKSDRLLATVAEKKGDAKLEYERLKNIAGEIKEFQTCTLVTSFEHRRICEMQNEIDNRLAKLPPTAVEPENE